MSWVSKKLTTPQQSGKDREAKILRSQGARAHPNSGSGRIPFDGSTEDEIIEVKTAQKVYALQAAYAERLYTTAVRQGKKATIILEFPELVIEIDIRRRG